MSEHEISFLFSARSSAHNSLLMREVTAEFMLPVIVCCYVILMYTALYNFQASLTVSSL